MQRRKIDLYGGQIKANQIGAMVKGDIQIDIIHPGFDIQGRKRHTWTQFCHEGIPIFEVKYWRGLDWAVQTFDRKWEKTFGTDSVKALEAIESLKSSRRSKFKDGISGESPAPALTKDGRGDGKVYPA